MDEFIIGLLLGLLLCFMIFMQVDDTFEYSETRYFSAIKVCENLSSTPKSYDGNGNLTCMNGAVVKNFVELAGELDEQN